LHQIKKSSLVWKPETCSSVFTAVFCPSRGTLNLFTEKTSVKQNKQQEKGKKILHHKNIIRQKLPASVFYTLQQK